MALASDLSISSDDESPIGEILEAANDSTIVEDCLEEVESEVSGPKRVRGPAATHPVWEHYSTTTNGEAVCNHCGKKISKKHGPTNAMNHLKVSFIYIREARNNYNFYLYGKV